jgi:imidazolonepropionase-like amidohydrolase
MTMTGQLERDLAMPDHRIDRRNALKVAGGAAALAAGGAALTAAWRPETASAAPAQGGQGTERQGELLLTADRVFDGQRMRAKQAVLVRGSVIASVGDQGAIRAPTARRIDLGDATLLPGFVDLHVHVTARGIPFDRVLTHGVTTVRDLGGSLPSAYPGPGQLRYVAAGSFITVPGGYPSPVFGPHGWIAVTGQEQARQAVRDLVHGGAAVIKIALDPGGEPGAPWSQITPSSPPPWPMLSVEEVAAIVAEAHRLDRIVTVHLGEETGARIALDGGLDEWAHSPSNLVPESLLLEAVRRGVHVVGTLDTESHGNGELDNARALVSMGATLLYGTDMGHLEIPNGIDAEELRRMMTVGLSLEQVLAAATSQAGKQLGLAPLGSLVPGAPADLISALGDPAQDLKNLEYPTLVIAGGQIVVEDGECVSS